MNKNYILLNRLAMVIAATVLLFAAATKYIMIMTAPIISVSFSQSREFMLISIFLTTGLGIWLVCGLFRKAAHLLAILAYSVFVLDNIYKIVIGSASCGCFGRVEVSPWITIFAVNIPILLLLFIFRPVGEKLLPPPFPKAAHFFAAAIPTFLLLALIVYTALAFEPPKATDNYRLVDHQSWIGSEFEMLSQIDVADELRSGFCLVLFYHNDCPNCREAVPVYSRMYDDFFADDDTTKIAFIEMPPYGNPAESPVPPDTQCITGTLDTTIKWYAASPLLVVIEDGVVLRSWDYVVPLTFDELMEGVFE